MVVTSPLSAEKKRADHPVPYHNSRGNETNMQYTYTHHALVKEQHKSLQTKSQVHEHNALCESGVIGAVETETSEGVHNVETCMAQFDILTFS